MNESKQAPALYKAVPVDFLWMPKIVRWWLGWITIVLFALSFFSPMFAMLLFLPAVWRNFPIPASIFLCSLVLSFAMKLREWPPIRKLGQLWYEIFDFSCNISREEALRLLDYCEQHQLILAMHPHGIVPFQAVLWSAYCDQYFTDGQRAMYGFGAAADVVAYVPFLRNVLAWLSGGSASYSVLRDGLVEGKSPVVNAAGRTPRHLYILPGGVAEIFTSKPGYNAIVFKSRKGLVKLSMETKAELVPCYVFGGTDFFHTLATSDSWLSKLSRRLKVGITIFWGQFGLPIPFAPKVTMVIGQPIPPPQIPWNDKPEEKEQRSQAIETLHQTFMKEMLALFDRYKALAGYPDSSLDIL